MKDELAQYYIRRGAFLTGHFELTGGGTSDFYIDGRLIATYPPALRLIAREHARLIAEHDLLPEDATLVGLDVVPRALDLEEAAVLGGHRCRRLWRDDRQADHGKGQSSGDGHPGRQMT